MTITITGARASGKSTILRKIYNYLKQQENHSSFGIAIEGIDYSNEAIKLITAIERRKGTYCPSCGRKQEESQ